MSVTSGDAHLVLIWPISIGVWSHSFTIFVFVQVFFGAEVERACFTNSWVIFSLLGTVQAWGLNDALRVLEGTASWANWTTASVYISERISAARVTKLTNGILFRIESARHLLGWGTLWLNNCSCSWVSLGVESCFVDRTCIRAT